MAGSSSQSFHVAPSEINIKAALKQLVLRLSNENASESIQDRHRHLEKRAWALLLDLDAAHQECLSNHLLLKARGPTNACNLFLTTQELLGVDDRAYSNQLAAEQACHDLRQQLRTAEAAKLQQLLDRWQRTSHYTPWVPENPQDLNPIPDPVPLTEHQAVVSLLFVLRGSCPAPHLHLTALPALGSAAIAEVQQRAEAAVTTARGSNTPPLPPPAKGDGLNAPLLKQLQQTGQAADRIGSSWIPAAFPATQLLQQVPLDAAMSLLNTAAAGDTYKHDQNSRHTVEVSGDKSCKITSLVDGLAAKMQLSSKPYQGLHKSLGGSIQGAVNVASRAHTKHGCRQQGASSKDWREPADSFEVSRAAVDAEAAVAAAAAMKPGVLPLMLQSSEQPGLADFVLLGNTIDRSEAAAAKVLDMLSCFRTSKQQQQQQQVVKEAAKDLLQQQMSPAAAQVAAEEELVATACLAVQGVWSAVGHIWDLAQQDMLGNTRSSRLVGFARPASSQHLLVKVLHMAELRLRLQVFLQHFQHGSTANSSSMDASVLHAFRAAVKGVLNRHDAAIQALQHEQRQRQRQLRQEASKLGRTVVRPPAMTLLQLVLLLHNVDTQLQQLAESCWCTVGTPVHSGWSFGTAECSTTSTSTQRLLKQGQTAWSNTCYASSNYEEHCTGGRINRLGTLGREPYLSKAAAAETPAAALPWPAAAAAWVRLWGWDPSRWQVQRGFMQGTTLAEHLYAGLLHAGPEAAPLLRHLFAAAVQPLLHQIYTWAFQPDIRAAEAAAAAAAMTSMTATGRPRSAAQSSGKGPRISSSSKRIQAAAQPFVLAAAAAGSAQTGQSLTAVDAGSSTTAADAVTDTAASELLLQTWLSAQDQAPECPSFLAGVQQQVAVAGLHLQLLQLLGGAGRQLAQRLGWLAELEQQELREVLASSSSDQEQPRCAQSTVNDDGDAVLAPARLQMGSSSAMSNVTSGRNSCSGHLLLLGSRGRASGTTSGMESAAATDAGAACLSFNLTISQLKHAAAVVADYEAARHSELSAIMGTLSHVKAAAAEAEKVQAAVRLQEKAAAEETRQQLQQAAAARKAQRKRQLLLEQQEMMAAAAARRAKSRTDELAFERSLLAQAARADHQAAMQQVQQEQAAAQKLGLQLQLPALQHQGVTRSSCDGSCEDLLAAVTTAEEPQAAPEATAAVVGAVQLLPDIVVVEQQKQPGLPVSDPKAPTQQQHEHQQYNDPGHKRATWGAAVFDPTPAAGRPSAGGAAVAAPLAVIGAAATSAADLPAAGRRSNSTPRVWGSVLNPGQRRPSSSGSAGSSGPAGSSGLSSRRTSWTGGHSTGLLQAFQHPDASLGAAATSSAGHQRPVVHSKWGLPVIPGAAAGVSSRQGRPSSAAAAAAAGGGGSIWGASPAWQQQQGSGPRAPGHSRGHSAGSRPSVADELSTDDVLLELMADDGGSATAGSTTTAAAGAGDIRREATMWRRQYQEHEEGDSPDNRQATAADKGVCLPTCSSPCDHLQHHDGDHQQQQEMRPPGSQSDSTAKAIAPLITTLEVLVVGPLLAQHRLTTLACWQLLLQEQHLLQKLAAMQALFFQQQADWVDLFAEGLDSLLSPAGSSCSSRASGSSSGQVIVERAGVMGAAEASQQVVSQVAAQLVLEAALQQSCLAGEAVSERLTVQVDPNRLLPGWTRGRSLDSSGDARCAAATDALVLQYDVPWPVSLLVSPEQQQQYSQIFSVLLRLRRLQQQLTKQWVALNSRSGSSSSSRVRLDVATAAAGSRRTSRTESRCISRAGSLTQQHKQQQQQRPDEQGGQEPGNSVTVDAAEDSQGLHHLQQLRRWHAMASHCVGSLLSAMLSELSGSLWREFESSVAPQPVSLPDIIQAHARLLAAAQEVCLLPRGSTGSSSSGGSRTQSSRVLTSGSSEVAAAAVMKGTSVAAVVYQLTDAAWLLQQQFQQLLQSLTEQTAVDEAAECWQAAAEGLKPAGSSSRVPESTSSRALAGMLAQNARHDWWHGVQFAGMKLEGLLKALRLELERNRASGVGETLAGLAARLGVYA